MSYTPTEWKSGDIVTSEKLNKLENGVAGAGGGGVLVVTATIENDVTTLDKTWKQIFDADFAVIIAEDQDSKTIATVAAVYINDNQYVVMCAGTSYVATSENGYPALGSGPK